MYSNVKNAFNRHLDSVPDRLSAAKRDATSLASSLRVVAVAGRTPLDAEIANHYIDGLKYGVAGSDGSFWSNYYYHTINNHELLSLFFADKRNPYNKPRRLFVIFSKISLSLLLSALFGLIHKNDLDSSYNTSEYFVPSIPQFSDSFIISLILCPYGYILDKIATCWIFNRANCCTGINAASMLGYCTLFTIALVSIFYLIAGILVIVYELHNEHYLKVFVISNLLDYLSYFYYGLWNWYLISWEGFLCIPILPWCRKQGIPGRFYPIYAWWIVQKFLQMYNLCESTYTEDKLSFQERFPERIAVDRLMTLRDCHVSDIDDSA